MHEIGSQEGIMYSGICANSTWHVASFPGQGHMIWEQSYTEHDLPFEHTCYLECPTHSRRTELVEEAKKV